MGSLDRGAAEKRPDNQDAVSRETHVLSTRDHLSRFGLPPNKRLEPTPPFSRGRIVFVNTRVLRRGSAAGR